jgi:hypothetical protein
MTPLLNLARSLQTWNVPEVFAECAASASALLHHIILHRRHLRLERIASDNLMCMRRADQTRVYQWIQTLHRKLRTSKAHHMRHLRGRSAAKGQKLE